MTDEARAAQQFTDERLLKLEKHLDNTDAELKKLSGSTSQVSAALDNIGNDLKKLRAEFADALPEAMKKVSEATVLYIDQRLGGSQPGSQLATTGQPQQKRGGLDGLFDKLGPTLDKVFDRYANSANLPFLAPQQSEIGGEIVDIEKQLKVNATLLYRNEMREMNRRIAVKLGLPTSEAVRVGASHT